MNQLQYGIKTELEHSKTIKKIQSKKVSVKDAAKLIAMDHLKEDPQYYKKLCKLEGRC